MACKIGKKEWWIIYAVTATLDFIQFVIIECILVWFFGAGALINEVLDPIVGILFALYLFLRGVSPAKYWKSYASILGMEALEELTGGAAQLWILDAWYIHKNIQQIEGAEQVRKEQEAFMQSNVQRPANQIGPDGTSYRPPENTHIAPAPSEMSQHPAPSRASNFNGVRRPGS